MIPKIRTMKREMKRDRETLQDRKLMFEREVRNYLLDEDKIDRYRSYFGNRPETIFRVEENENVKKPDDLVCILNSIDRCFVDGDEDGIMEIMKKAEENAGLSK